MAYKIIIKLAGIPLRWGGTNYIGGTALDVPSIFMVSVVLACPLASVILMVLSISNYPLCLNILATILLTRLAYLANGLVASRIIPRF